MDADAVVIGTYVLGTSAVTEAAVAGQSVLVEGCSVVARILVVGLASSSPPEFA